MAGGAACAPAAPAHRPNVARSVRVVETERLVGLVLHVARYDVRFVGVLAAGEDTHERLAGSSKLVNEPEDIALGFAPRASVSALDFAQAPFELCTAASRAAVTEAVGTDLRPIFGDVLPTRSR